MRNTTKFSLVIISALLLSACGAKTPTGTPQAGETPTGQNQSFSLRDLVASGKNQKCTLSQTQTDDKGIKTDTNGTVYISGKKMAEEVQITSTDPKVKTINMRVISDGTFMYTWDTADKSQGMKLSMTEPTPGATGNTQSQSGVNLDEKVDMKCSIWIADNSKFTVPTDVKFTDLSELMKNIPTMPANIPAGY